MQLDNNTQSKRSKSILEHFHFGYLRVFVSCYIKFALQCTKKYVTTVQVPLNSI